MSPTDKIKETRPVCLTLAHDPKVYILLTEADEERAHAHHVIKDSPGPALARQQVCQPCLQAARVSFRNSLFCPSRRCRVLTCLKTGLRR